MNENRRRRKLPRIALASLLAAVLIGSTFAYWNQTSTIENPFDTGEYGSTVKEDFKPEEGKDWQPGSEVNKDVVAVNTGDQDLIVRVKLDERWERKSADGVSPGVLYKDNTNYDLYTTSQANSDDGLTSADGSVVIKNFATSDNWINGEDGWYYYKVNLAGGESTDRWLDSVQLMEQADMGKFETKNYVTTSTGTNESTWVWIEYTGEMPAYLNDNGDPCEADATGAKPVLHNMSETTYAQLSGEKLLGYSQSEYTLTVTVQTVQPTQDALNEVFGGGTAFVAPMGTAWVLKD